MLTSFKKLAKLNLISTPKPHIIPIILCDHLLDTGAILKYNMEPNDICEIPIKSQIAIVSSIPSLSELCAYYCVTKQGLKYLLQRNLPEELKEKITKLIFNCNFLGCTQKTFTKQSRVLVINGKNTVTLTPKDYCSKHAREHVLNKDKFITIGSLINTKLEDILQPLQHKH